MSDLRQAAELALDLMEVTLVNLHGYWREESERRITALRAALAEPEQEPVAWEQFHPDIGKPQTTHWQGCEAVHPECKKENT